MKHGLLCGSKVMCSEEVDSKIWGLFIPMLEKGKPVEHIAEIIERAKEGAIDFDRPFNLYGYETVINQNDDKKVRRKCSKETFIDFSGDRDTSPEAERGGIGIDVVSFQADAMSEAKNDFEVLFDNEELKYAVETIKALNEDFIVDFSVDLIALIKSAVKQHGQAVVKLKEICSEMPSVAEQIKTILTSGVSVEDCFA